MEEFAYPDRGQMAAAICEHLATALAEAIARDGTASLVVPGGTTPVSIFDRLSATELPWENVNVLPCDERWVAVDHPDSNEGLVRRHLLRDRAVAARIFALYRPVPTPGDARRDVARALQAVKRPFDAVFLGMGEDGHIASLFPGRPETAPALALDRPGDLPQDLMVLALPAKGHPRIGLTLQALTDARRLILAVAGPAKRAVLEDAIAHIDENDRPVAALLRQTRVKVDIMLCP